MKVYGNDIYTVRGDTIIITLTVKNANGSPKSLGDDDSVVFSVKKNLNDSEFIIGPLTLNKGQGTGVAVLNIPHNTTKELELGEYVYDIKLQTKRMVNNVEVYDITTIIPRSKFIVEGDITNQIVVTSGA